jgi:galactokinase
MTNPVNRPPALQRALDAGRAAFGSRWQPTLAATAPGRLELLGNHVDYNGGPVLASAIDRSVVVLVEPEPGATGVEVVFADVADGQRSTLILDDLRDWRNPSPPPESVDYPRGVIAAALARCGVEVRSPIRVAVAGDVPIGFGLSSSAALCVALTLALHTIRPDDRELVLRAQEAEHRAGTPCGTMDQSASVAGGVIRYDGTTLAVDRLDPDLGDLVFAVADSGVERSLGASSYPVRVAESAKALEIARAVISPDLPNLAAIDSQGLETLARLSADELSPLLLRRIRHVVTETDRVRKGVEAMQRRDWTTFGLLMTASGHSSAVDYEISHPRVEELVSEAQSVDGVLGARMMGGGEGGTALALLPGAAVPTLTEALRRGYYARHRMADRTEAVHVFAFAPGATVGPFVEPRITS